VVWPWKQGYGSFKVIENGTIWYIAYEFLFAFHSNYGAILYRLRDIATYWYKIAKFLYPTCIQRPRRGWPRRNFVKMFEADKTRMIGLPYGEKQWRYIKPVFIQYRSVTDGRTDGRSEILYQYCASVCWRAIKTITISQCFLQPNQKNPGLSRCN